MLPDVLAFHNGQWAMEESALHALLSIAPQALSAYASKPLQSALKATVRDAVAIVPVEGTLFRKPNFITEILGASTYQTIRQDLQTALDNPAVKGVLLSINSPGGEMAGTAELAQAIRNARGPKPIVAYAGDLAASAAYWIASAADQIIIGRSAALGSIGVLAGYEDASARDARSGVQKIDFVSSQSPHKRPDPKTEGGRARIQARVDALADVFINAVASNRGVPREAVLSDFGQGDVFIGQAAITAGLADELGSFESVLANLASGTPVSRRSTISATRTTPVTATAPKPAPAPAPPHVAAKQAHAVAVLQAGAGHPELTKQAIHEGWPVEKLRAQVEEEEAVQSMLAHFRRR